MITLLSRFSNWKFIVPAFFLMIFFLYLFQNGQAEMNKIAGAEVPMIDVRQSYNLEEVNDFFTKLTSEGRAIHQHLTGVIDMLFPFSYGILFILILAFLLKNIFGKDSKWLYLSLFPILVMIVDYMENTNTLAMLNAFPNLTEALVNKGCDLTELKHLLVLCTYGLILLGGVAWLVKWARNRGFKN